MCDGTTPVDSKSIPETDSLSCRSWSPGRWENLRWQSHQMLYSSHKPECLSRKCRLLSAVCSRAQNGMFAFFLYLFLILLNFIYLFNKPILVHPLLSLPASSPSPHPTSHLFLRESKASLGKSIKSVPSSWDRTKPFPHPPNKDRNSQSLNAHWCTGCRIHSFSLLDSAVQKQVQLLFRRQNESHRNWDHQYHKLLELSSLTPRCVFVLFSRICVDKIEFCEVCKPGSEMRGLRIFGLTMIYEGKSLQISCQLEGSLCSAPKAESPL